MGRVTVNLSQGLLWVIPVTKIVTTDASGRGWGAHLGAQLTQVTWKVEEFQRSSNWKELRVVSLALKAFQGELRGHHL